MSTSIEKPSWNVFDVNDLDKGEKETVLKASSSLFDNSDRIRLQSFISGTLSVFPFAKVLVAKSDDKILGILTTRFADIKERKQEKEGRKPSYLEKMVVARQYRGQGVETSLISTLIEGEIASRKTHLFVKFFSSFANKRKMEEPTSEESEMLAAGKLEGQVFDDIRSDLPQYPCEEENGYSDDRIYRELTFAFNPPKQDVKESENKEQKAGSTEDNATRKNKLRNLRTTNETIDSKLNEVEEQGKELDASIEAKRQALGLPPRQKHENQHDVAADEVVDEDQLVPPPPPPIQLGYIARIRKLCRAIFENFVCLGCQRSRICRNIGLTIITTITLISYFVFFRSYKFRKAS